MGITSRQYQILISLAAGGRSLSDLLALPAFAGMARRTLQRDLGALVDADRLERHGEARSVTYSLIPSAASDLVVPPRILDAHLSSENRSAIRYDFDRLERLASVELFSPSEQMELRRIDRALAEKLAGAPEGLVRRERERITIELSWKSSQFEGNTYTLLETETLLKDGIPARGKSQEETRMVLNHKRALDFADEHPSLFAGRLEPQTIIELHRHLADGLFDTGLREYDVGITGSVYQPLDNRFPLGEELERLCDVINRKTSVYDKALLAFTYLCYLQAFNDGNKRTGRILADAILHAHGSFPLSLRAVDVETYKLAVLAFYELGTLDNAKEVFLAQARFVAARYLG